MTGLSEELNAPCGGDDEGVGGPEGAGDPLCRERRRVFGGTIRGVRRVGAGLTGLCSRFVS